MPTDNSSPNRESPPDFRIESLDEPGMEAFAAELAARVRGGETILLEGPLGAGKTFFTRAFARALGVTSGVSSPTYVLHCVHAARNRLQLHHFDFYRLVGDDDASGLGIDEFQSPESVVVVEWPDRCPNAIGSFAVRLRLDILDEGHRRIAGWWGTDPFNRKGLTAAADSPLND
jgi:tRNA threonylcarbamoyladenosine biosynthesis protein TsaE